MVCVMPLHTVNGLHWLCHVRKASGPKRELTPSSSSNGPSANASSTSYPAKKGHTTVDVTELMRRCVAPLTCSREREAPSVSWLPLLLPLPGESASSRHPQARPVKYAARRPAGARSFRPQQPSPHTTFTLTTTRTDLVVVSAHVLVLALTERGDAPSLYK